MLVKFYYQCGHIGTMEFNGDKIFIAEKVKRLRKYCCPCCMAKKAEAYALENKLPLLQGSYKQIAYAHTIRCEIIKYLNQCKKKLPLIKGKQHFLCGLKIFKLKNLLKSQEKAEFWIRNKNVEDLFSLTINQKLLRNYEVVFSLE